MSFHEDSNHTESVGSPQARPWTLLPNEQPVVQVTSYRQPPPNYSSRNSYVGSPPPTMRHSYSGHHPMRAPSRLSFDQPDNRQLQRYNPPEPTEHGNVDASVLAQVTTGIRIGRLETENKSMADKLAQTKQKYRDTVAEIKRLSEENNSLRSSLQALQAAQDKTTAEIQGLRQENDKLKVTGTNDASAAAEGSTMEKPDLKTENKRLRKERNYYRERCHAAENEVSQLSSPRLPYVQHARNTSTSNTIPPVPSMSSLRHALSKAEIEGKAQQDAKYAESSSNPAGGW